MGGALERLKHLTQEAIDVIPPCRGQDAMRTEIEAQTRLFMPVSLRAMA